MDFGFTEEQDKLRKELRDFFINELPEDYQVGFGYAGYCRLSTPIATSHIISIRCYLKIPDRSQD